MDLIKMPIKLFVKKLLVQLIFDEQELKQMINDPRI